MIELPVVLVVFTVALLVGSGAVIGASLDYIWWTRWAKRHGFIR